MNEHAADFDSYQLEDFIDDPQFILWVTTPDDALNAFWQNIQQKHPRVVPIIADARSIVSSMRFSAESMSHMAQQQLWDKIKTELSSTVAVTLQEKPVFHIPVWLRATAAIFLFGLLSISIFFYTQQQELVVTTGFGQVKSLTLPDGSVVTLNANSKLHYAKNWNAAAIREVWIDGEAFFKVNHLHQSGQVKASDRFIVHAEKLNVEVLGTSFNVNNRRGEVKVALVTGRVGIGLNGAGNAQVKLLPGELAEYLEQGNSITKKRIYATEYTSWKDGRLHFNNTPLTEIFKLIEDNYGYQVITNDVSIGNRRLSGTFSVSSEDAFFKAISTSLRISLKKNPETHQLIIK